MTVHGLMATSNFCLPCDEVFNNNIWDYLPCPPPTLEYDKFRAHILSQDLDEDVLNEIATLCGITASEEYIKRSSVIFVIIVCVVGVVLPMFIFVCCRSRMKTSRGQYSLSPGFKGRRIEHTEVRTVKTASNLALKQLSTRPNKSDTDTYVSSYRIELETYKTVLFIGASKLTQSTVKDYDRNRKTDTRIECITRL